MSYLEFCTLLVTAIGHGGFVLMRDGYDQRHRVKVQRAEIDALSRDLERRVAEQTVDLQTLTGKKRMSSRHLARFEEMFDVRVELLTPAEQQLIQATRRGGLGLPKALQACLGDALNHVLPAQPAAIPKRSRR